MKERIYHILGIHPDSVSLPAILIRQANGHECFLSGFTGHVSESDLEEGDEVACFATLEEVDAWMREAKADKADWTYALWVKKTTVEDLIPSIAAAMPHATLISGVASLYSHRVLGNPCPQLPLAHEPSIAHIKSAATATELQPQALRDLLKAPSLELDTKRQQLAQSLDLLGYLSQESDTSIPESGIAPSISKSFQAYSKDSSLDSADA